MSLFTHRIARDKRQRATAAFADVDPHYDGGQPAAGQHYSISWSELYATFVVPYCNATTCNVWYCPDYAATPADQTKRCATWRYGFSPPGMDGVRRGENRENPPPCIRPLYLVVEMRESATRFAFPCHLRQHSPGSDAALPRFALPGRRLSHIDARTAHIRAARRAR